MEESIEFKAPKFLEGATEEHFTNLAMSVAPPGTDTSQGQMYYDHTKPTAIIATEITEFHMPIVLQMLFPQFAEGVYLDLHGEPYNVFRRRATKATGIVKIESREEGRSVPAGILFYTLGDEYEESKEYISIESGIIEGGFTYVKVESVTPGVIGNSVVGTILSPQSGYGIDSVIVAEVIDGGTEEESDESLRERILSRVALAPLSGSRRDYERWAKEVDGVGSVIVQPLWNGAQTVRLLITDSNNQIANEDLISRVKEYIDPEEYEGLGEGQAPIGAIVTVDTVEPFLINIEAHIYFEASADSHLTLQRAKTNINQYLLNVSIVRVAEVGAVLIETDGVLDYRDLKLNDQIGNIELSESQRAVVGEVINSGS